MAGTNSLIDFLRMNDRSFEEIKSFLERYPLSINETDEKQRSPLFRVLNSPCCSTDIVRLFLQYGTSIDSRDEFGDTHLTFAIKYAKNEAVITELIDKGANVNVHNEDGLSPLCLVFCKGHSKELVERLLKECGSIQACTEHETVVNCLLSHRIRSNTWFTEVLRLLIEAGADVTKVDYMGRSPLCYVLSQSASIVDIKLLLSKGASFTDCQLHASPLFCVTSYSRALLKADMVELLLNTGASVEEVDNEGSTPLELALICSRYDDSAMRFLIDQACKNKTMANIRHAKFGNLLHAAAANRFCKPSIVKLLLRNGVRSDEVDVNGRTPLHNAMIWFFRDITLKDLRIITLLIKYGSPVNLKDKEGFTPLSLAVKYKMEGNVFHVLLAAGAFIDLFSTNEWGDSELEQVLKDISWCGINRFKILFKWILIKCSHFYIKYPHFYIQDLLGRQSDNVEELTSFAEECVIDLQRMEYVQLSHGLTLRQFVTGYFPQNFGGDCEEKLNFDLHELLGALSKNPFFNFSDVISSKISKSLLMDKLHQLSVYTVKPFVNYPCIKPKIVCNNDSLRNIAKYLPKQDLLCLVLAFYFTCK